MVGNRHMYRAHLNSCSVSLSFSLLQPLLLGSLPICKDSLLFFSIYFHLCSILHFIYTLDSSYERNHMVYNHSNLNVLSGNFWSQAWLVFDVWLHRKQLNSFLKWLYHLHMHQKRVNSLNVPYLTNVFPLYCLQYSYSDGTILLFII